MPVELFAGQSVNHYKSRNNRNDNISDGSAFRVYDVQEKTPTKVKVGVFLTTLAGVAAAMAWTFKAQKLPMKLSTLWKIKYNEKNNEVPKLVGRLTAGSVGGGLTGGALFDKKENLKAKLREAVIQVVGNIATPLACVCGGMALFNKKIEPKIKLPGKMADVPKVVATIGCLVAGIFAGNKIGNYINKKAFNCDEKRNLKLTDMSPHIDDLGIATSFVVPPEHVIGQTITRIIPAALMIAGLSTGMAQEKHHHRVHNQETKS